MRIQFCLISYTFSTGYRGKCAPIVSPIMKVIIIFSFYYCFNFLLYFCFFFIVFCAISKLYYMSSVLFYLKCNIFCSFSKLFCYFRKLSGKKFAIFFFDQAELFFYFYLKKWLLIICLFLWRWENF